MQKNLIIIIVCFLIVFSLFFGITGVGAEEKPMYLSFGTGMATGTWYLAGEYIGKLLKENCPLIKGVTVQVTAGSLENARLLQNEELDIIMFNIRQAYSSTHGLPPFDKENVDKVRTLMKGHGSVAHFIVLKESKIEHLEDLKGKRVATGAAGSGIVTFCREILDVYGISPDDIDERFLTYKEATEALQDRKIDCAFVSAYYPTGIVTSLNASRPIRLLALEEKKEKEFLEKYPWYGSVTIPANVYKGVDYPVKVVDSGTLYCVGSFLSDDLVYEMLKCIHENLETLSDYHPVLKTLNFDWDPEKINEYCPLHPGAIKYYKEIGKM